MVDSDDRRLVERCLTGDRSAFEGLVDKYQRAVYNLALRMVQGPEDAEDIAQAAFVKAYERLGTYKSEYRFFSWLYRIAVNESLDFLEHKKRFTGLGDAEEVAAVEEADRGETEELSAMLGNALQELKPDHRAVVVLKHLEGLSYEEIGRILQIPEKKVKSRLFSARQSLRDLLMKKGVGKDD
jgi:RNA polymerase sigma-70 factor (ECF subfamily)